LPAAVLELHAALDDERISHGEIAAIIYRDPPLATRLLRLANSAAFNRGQPVGDVSGAVHLLGIRQVRALCVALSVVNAFSGRRGALPHQSFWQHSVGVAVVARELGRQLGCGGLPPEQLYIGGLLHDVGLLLLDQYFPDTLHQSVEIAHDHNESLAIAESGAWGIDHGEVGGFLLGRWSVPAPVVAMVAGHHHPQSSSVQYRDACWLIYASELLCSGFGLSLDVEHIGEMRAIAVLRALQSNGHDIQRVLERVDAEDAAIFGDI
jgi:putative nucleotidyltransferase with HDIG domain